MGESLPPLSSGAVDRDAGTRASGASLRTAWSDPSTRVLRVCDGLVPVIGGDGTPTRLALTDSAAVSAGSGAVLNPERPESTGPHYLGRVSGTPVFAVADPHDGGPSSPEHSDAEGGEERWIHPFADGHLLSPAERELMAEALALLRWHETADFAPDHGGRTTPTTGGWVRVDEHGAEHFPRTDPAVIVLIEHEGRVLLGSNALWEAGRFSLLAGFVEVGESLEATVRREMAEEAGVEIGEITYVASQPWPFPRSLMVGFRAKLAPGADPQQLSADPAEIAELRWFTAEEIADPPAGVTLPGPLSIARWMIDRWADEVLGSSVAGRAHVG